MSDASSTEIGRRTGKNPGPRTGLRSRQNARLRHVPVTRRVAAWVAAVAHDPGTSLRFVIGFAVAHALLWTIILTALKSAQDVHMDVAEAYAWGQKFLLCYGKHLPLAGWIAGEKKYLHSSRPESYDLARDEHETRDLFPEPQESVRAARDGIGRLLSKPCLPAAAAGLPESLVRELRRLGYGASGGVLAAIPHPLAASDLAAPRDRAAELEPLLIANALLDAQNYTEAAPKLAAIVAANPRHLLALDLYGFCLLQLARYEEARDVLARRVAGGVARADTLVNWAVACERTQRADEARGHFERALEIDAANLQALEGLLRLAIQRQDASAIKSWEGRLRAARAPSASKQ